MSRVRRDKYLKNLRIVNPGPIARMALNGNKGRVFVKSNLLQFIQYGNKICVWCNKNATPNNRSKYCSDRCKYSSDIWCYPGRSMSRNYLANKQDFKCAICGHDWAAIKYEEGREPETDHITPIYKGGESLGVDNLQLICKTCHKAKTREDMY